MFEFLIGAAVGVFVALYGKDVLKLAKDAIFGADVPPAPPAA